MIILNGGERTLCQRFFIMLTAHGDVALVTAYDDLLAFVIRASGLIQAQHHAGFTPAEANRF